MRPHKVLDHKDENVHALQLTEGVHAGIIFSYGKVDFEEDDSNDAMRIKFEYDVHDDRGVQYDKEAFEQELGDFLIELIEFGLEQNELVYTGGVDENRTDDSEQSDPQ